MPNIIKDQSHAVDLAILPNQGDFFYFNRYMLCALFVNVYLYSTFS